MQAFFVIQLLTGSFKADRLKHKNYYSGHTSNCHKNLLRLWNVRDSKAMNPPPRIMRLPIEIPSVSNSFKTCDDHQMLMISQMVSRWWLHSRHKDSLDKKIGAKLAIEIKKTKKSQIVLFE